jgi:serine/threonine protein kinase
MSSLAPNDRLGHYEIERILGAGGMGVVYRAFDTRLQRSVAIKLINPTDQFNVSRQVLGEARAASALNHPNICTIHEVAEHGDRSFIVMEYIEGQPLSDVIAEGSTSQERVLELALQVVGALAHAHERKPYARPRVPPQRSRSRRPRVSTTPLCRHWICSPRDPGSNRAG